MDSLPMKALSLPKLLLGIEKRLVRKALIKNQGNRTKAALELGINRTTLVMKLKSPEYSNVLKELEQRQMEIAQENHKAKKFFYVADALKALGADSIIISDGYPEEIITAKKIWGTFEEWEVEYYAKKAYRKRMLETHPDINRKSNVDRIQYFRDAYDRIRQILKHRKRYNAIYKT